MRKTIETPLLANTFLNPPYYELLPRAVGVRNKNIGIRDAMPQPMQNILYHEYLTRSKAGQK